MENTFDIFELSETRFRYVIINKDFYSLGNKLPLINQELSKKNYTGDVIFNTLTSTCNKKRQYSKVFFDGSEIQLKSLISLKNVDASISEFVNSYFHKNSHLIKNLPIEIY